MCRASDGLSKYRHLIYQAFVVVGAMAITLASCKHELEELIFFGVVTGEVTKMGVDRVRLTGRVTNLQNSSLNRYGFLLSTSDQDPTLSTADLRFEYAGTLPSTGEFAETTPALSLKSSFIVRAFAVMGEREVLGESRRFNLTENALVTLEKVTVSNDRAQLEAEVLLNVQDTLEDYGVVYGKSIRPIAYLDSTFSSGKTRNDQIFDFTAQDLDLNSTYYARAFFRVGDSIVYSEPPTSFVTRDGWKLLDTLQAGVYDPVATTDGERGYVGFGCSNLCDTIESNRFWSVRPDEAPLSRLEPLDPTGIGRRHAIAVESGGLLYFGLGDVEGIDSNAFLSDFWSYDPRSASWTPLAPYPEERSGATGFALDRQIYVGTGKDEGNNERQDFYSYDIDANAWSPEPRLMLPVSIGGQKRERGRFNAFTFSLHGDIYIGGGSRLFTPLPDLWVLDLASLSWRLVDGDLPLKTTDRAIAIGIEATGKAYLGFGQSRAVFSNEWWEFDGAAWAAREPFPILDDPRVIKSQNVSFGFAIGNHGYVGGGNAINNVLEIWQYVALEN